MSKEVCNDCFDEFKPINDEQDECLECVLTVDECVHIYKCCSNKNRLSDREKKQLDIAKKVYKHKTGKELK
jgi:hypothetical protein